MFSVLCYPCRLKQPAGATSKPAETPVETEAVPVPPAPTEEPPEVLPQELPPAPEPPKPGTVPGPFKINVDLPKMWASVHARDDGGRGTKYKVELSKEELQMLDQEPVEMPRLFSK